MPAKKGNQYAKGNKGGGNLPKYKKEYCSIAKSMCLLGATDMQLADCFDVTEKTINNWKLKYKEFHTALKEGKLIADGEIAQSLHNRARGMIIKETKTSDDGSIVVTEKEIPPDPTSMIFWLKNRQPSKFRDKPKDDNTEDLIEGFKEIAKALKGE